MSISDLIVVMKEGLVQQTGKPQEVYDEPVNLFVAKFLGTPPINVFDGEVKGGKLYIGAEDVLDASGAADQAVTVGIRPEGFVPDANGPFTCGLTRIEVMGRDVSVVCTHEKAQNASVRAIIGSGSEIGAGETVRFSLKRNKVFLFHKETEERIRF